MKEIIDSIEYMRLKLEMSKRELALKASISEEYYWKIVTNQAHGCSYTIIQALAASVGIQITHNIDMNVLNQLEMPKKKAKK